MPFSGEGNGSPLQCSRLENPRDGGAWWAVISGVAQSRTRLKQLSNSSSTPFSGAPRAGPGTVERAAGPVETAQGGGMFLLLFLFLSPEGIFRIQVQKLRACHKKEHLGRLVQTRREA